jgi:hypothetical protein
MAVDESVVERVRAAFARRLGAAAAEEKRMFGGVAFLVGGHMACGVVGDELMVRVGADQHAAALARRHARPMDFTGRPLRGMVFVAPDGFRTATALGSWIDAALQFATSLPPKPRTH